LWPVLALVPWSVRGFYEAPAVEHKACLPSMGCEPSCLIKHPAVIHLDYIRADVNAVSEALGCRRVRDYIGKEVDVR